MERAPGSGAGRVSVVEVAGGADAVVVAEPAQRQAASHAAQVEERGVAREPGFAHPALLERQGEKAIASRGQVQHHQEHQAPAQGRLAAGLAQQAGQGW